MDANGKENSQAVQQPFDEQVEYHSYPFNGDFPSSSLYPSLSTMGFSNASEGEASSGDSHADSSDSEDEVSLLHDGEAKKKIEILAAMVGIHTSEPAIVLTEVVRVLKHLKRINQF